MRHTCCLQTHGVLPSCFKRLLLRHDCVAACHLRPCAANAALRNPCKQRIRPCAGQAQHLQLIAQRRAGRHNGIRRSYLRLHTRLT